MTTVGELALWTAFLLAVWGMVAGIAAVRGDPARTAHFAESTRRALRATALLLALALAGVASALLALDLSLEFVAGSTSLNLPTAYRLAALMSRPEGSLLALACVIALAGAAALPPAARVEGDPGAAFPATLCAMVLAPLAAVMLAFYPYARSASRPGEGSGLDPAWQNAIAPLARAALVIATALFAVALAQWIVRRPARRWWLAAWGSGAVALVLVQRRALTGARWSALEWLVLAGWLVLAAALHRRRDRARLAAHLAHAGAVVALIAGAGLALGADHRVLLAGGVPSTLRDPLGGRWQITSEGLSAYEELNRHVAAVLVDAARDGGRARVLRTEWRLYVDATGTPLGTEVPVAAVRNGVLMSMVVQLVAPPRGDDGVFAVRFVPFFAWWWVATAFFISAAAAGAMKEPAR